MTQLNSALFISILLLFVLRVMPMLTVAKDFIISDALAHQFHINEAKHLRWKLLNRSLQYPVVFHILLSYIPASPKALHVLLPFFFDLLILLALFFGVQRMVEADILRESYGAFTLYLYPLYPATVSQNYGPRSYGLNERIAIEATSNIVLLVVVFSNTPLSVIILVPILIFMLASSKFSNQIVAFIFVPSSFILPSFPLLFSIIFSYIILFLIRPLHYKTRILNQINHLRWYVKFLKMPDCWAGHRNRIPRKHAGESARSYFLRLLKFVLRDNGILVGLVSNGLMILSVALFVIHVENPPHLLLSCFKIVSISIIVWILTSFGVLKIFGESERYLNSAMAPGILLFSYMLQYFSISFFYLYLLIAVLFIYWIFWVLYLSFISKKHKNKRQSIERLLEDFFLPDGKRIISLTPIYECWLILEKFGDRYWWHEQFTTLDFSEMFRYPFPRMETIISGKYHYIIVDNDSLNDLIKEEASYSEILKFKKLMELDHLGLYEIAR